MISENESLSHIARLPRFNHRFIIGATIVLLMVQPCMETDIRYSSFPCVSIFRRHYTSNSDDSACGCRTCFPCLRNRDKLDEVVLIRTDL